MSTKNTNSSIQNSYCKNNRVRTKLLLLIDNEIQSKIKQNNLKLKYKYEDETLFRMNFEETFIQKQINKYYFSSSKILETGKKNENSDKSLSTDDGSSNKGAEKSYQNGRNNNHCRTVHKKGNRTNKLLDNSINFHKKMYSIKNLSKQSSTFLILPKQKNAAKYLKTLCNNLKICKNYKKTVKQTKAININIKSNDFSSDKKVAIKSNKIKLQKPKKDNNLNNFCLFRKPKKKSVVVNSKNRTSGKNNNSIFKTKKEKEKVVFYY